MTGELETLLHTEGQISEYFALETLLVSTRTADLYKARDKSRSSHILLWIGKQALVPNSPAVREFLLRMADIQSIEPPLANIVSYGVDAAGIPFVILSGGDGYVVTQGNVERAEAERRFMACLKIVDRLHNAGIVCGDLCGNSFWVERSGEVKLIGVMGSFEKDLVGEKIAAFNEVIPYLSPEQLDGQIANAKSDVYSIGVLGYKILSGRLPFENQGGLLGAGGAPLLSQVMVSPPLWGDQVIAVCLSEESDNRYSNAGAILAAINQVRENKINSENTPARVGRESRLIKSTSLNSQKQQAASPENLPAAKKRMLVPVLLALALGIAITFLFFDKLLPDGPKQASSIDTAIGLHGGVINAEAIKVAAGRSAEAEKEEAIRKMVMSDDPVMHDILIKAAIEAKTDAERQQAETAILDRARRLGLRRSAEIVRPWLRSIGAGALPETYQSMLRTLDATLPAEARNAALLQAYPTNKRLIVRLTAALALDTGKYDQYQPVLAQLVADSIEGEDISNRSLLAIILYSPELTASFADDVIQKREHLHNEDIVWILDILAKRNDYNVRPLASLAVEKNLLPPIRQFYLASIRDKENLPIELLNTLVKASAGAASSEDVLNFVNWFDRSSDALLLALCADAPDPKAKVAALEVLSGKSLVAEPAATLVKWVKDNAWDKRVNFAESIGIVSNLNFYNSEDVYKALGVFDPYIGGVANQVLINSFLESSDPKLANAAVKRYSKKMGVARRLQLLDHHDKDVRILGLIALTEINDVIVQKIIIDHYNAESDASVRQAYRENYEMIREREKK